MAPDYEELLQEQLDILEGLLNQTKPDIDMQALGLFMATLGITDREASDWDTLGLAVSERQVEWSTRFPRIAGRLWCDGVPTGSFLLKAALVCGAYVAPTDEEHQHIEEQLAQVDWLGHQMNELEVH